MIAITITQKNAAKMNEERINKDEVILKAVVGAKNSRCLSTILLNCEVKAKIIQW